MATFAAAQAPDGSESLSLHTSFDHYWRRYLQAAGAGDAEGASRMLEEIKRLRVERNAFALHDVGLSFVYQGSALLENGELEDARKHFEIARDLSPNLPTAYWGLARLDERTGIFGYPTAVARRVQAQLAALRSERDGPYATWNLLFLLFTAAAIVFSVFAVVLLYRYGILLFHDLDERFGDSIGAKGVLAATLGVVFLPVIVTAGIGWVAPYWLAVTFGYQNVKERALSVLAMLLLLAAAPFAELYATWSRTVSNPVYQAALSSTTGTFDVDDVLVLREAIRQSPNDRHLQFLLATQYKNLGDYELAANQYRRILESFPGDAEAQLNLGNVYFAQRDWDGALAQYNRVIGSSPSMAMAYYNKSLAHAENFQFAEREDARARAVAIDSAAIDAFERRSGSYRVVADVRLDERDILDKFYGLPDGMRERPAETFLDASFFEGWGMRFVVASVLFGALILALEMFFRERKLTKRCWKCGGAFCGRCQIGTGRKGLCTQCYHLFFMKDGVSADARNEKLGQVHRVSTKRSLVYRALSIVAPGSGHISAGMPILGVFFLSLWTLAACVFFLGGSLYSLPDGLFGLGTSPSHATIVVMVSMVVLANVVGRPMSRGQ
jgi:tetratricopeptide (TPR) repeat protein